MKYRHWLIQHKSNVQKGLKAVMISNGGSGGRKTFCIDLDFQRLYSKAMSCIAYNFATMNFELLEIFLIAD